MNLQSLGHAAGLYQRDPRELAAMLPAVQAQAAAAAGKPVSREATPALRLNGIAYYEADEIIAAVALLARLDAERAISKAAEAAGDG